MYATSSNKHLNELQKSKSQTRTKTSAGQNDDAQAAEKDIAGRSDGGSGDDNDGHQASQVSSEVSGAGAISAGSESAVPCEVRL